LSSRRNELTVPTAVGTKALGLSLTRLDPPESDLLVVFQDLTALRRTEDALRQADHLAALGRLSAQLAHEIRNPLAAMRGSAQLIADDAAKAGEAGRLPGILIRESDRLGALLEDFLRFARPAVPKRQRTSLHDLVAQVLEMFRGDPLAREVTLIEELSPTHGAVDADQLRQVVLNLLRNACSAAGPGGTVKVGVERSAASARLRVWDSAGSIAPADLPRLFEPFFTRRPGGTGLGLSTTHSIVHAHGGTIEVSSSPQDGTEFVVALPPAPEEESVDPDRR
jgi:two-component system sensor histidine kinase PilS (NtrC family)